MKILILGSEGVIGSSLKKRLEKNHEVIQWDKQLSVNHDLTNSENNKYLIEACDSCDFVFFLAYDIGGSKYLQDIPYTFIDNNVHIMSNVFKCLKHKPFIFASSQMVNMDNVYGTLKTLGEQYTNFLGGLSIRFWNVYGPEVINDKSHVIPDFIHSEKTYGKINIRTTGTEQRQFLYTDDCAECLEIIMNNFDKIKLEHKYVDVSSFKWTSIKQVADLISNNVYTCSKVDNVQIIKNEPSTYILNFWKPKTDLKTGIECIIEQWTN